MVLNEQTQSIVPSKELPDTKDAHIPSLFGSFIFFMSIVIKTFWLIFALHKIKNAPIFC